jgi:hypothetical protein
MNRSEFRIKYTYQFNGVECQGIHYTYNIKNSHIRDILETLDLHSKKVQSIEFYKNGRWEGRDISRYTV